MCTNAACVNVNGTVLDPKVALGYFYALFYQHFLIIGGQDESKRQITDVGQQVGHQEMKTTREKYRSAN